MYKSFYNLESKPFETKADPTFLWLGKQHKEALSILRYGIFDNMGFLLLTGGAGTGKTTLIHGLTKGLKSDVIWTIMEDPDLERIEFYNKITAGFGINKNFTSKVQFLIQFSHFLHQSYDKGKKVVLFIDDCHLLSQGLLEELRLLSNIEKADAKLIDIFFIGRPEFNELLAQSSNRAIRERLGLKAKLVPFDASETGDYIRHRLKISGSVENIFSTRAIQAVHQFSKGVPEDINVLCRYVLQTGAAQEKRIIDEKLIVECAGDMGLTGSLNQVDLSEIPVEKQQIDPPVVEEISDNDDLIVADEITAGVGKRRGWLLLVLPVLACIGVGLYLFVFKKEIPVVVETEGVVAGMEMKEPAVGEAVSVIEPEPKKESLAVEEVEIVYIEVAKKAEEVEEVEDNPGEEVVEQTGIQGQAVVDEKKDPPGEIEELPEVIKEPALPPIQPGKIILGLQPNALTLTEQADKKFTGFVEKLLQYPNVRLEVRGYVSSNNDSPENIKLSEERAASVQQLLIMHGVDAANIEVKGMGIQDPIATNDTRAGRLKNRRVEIEVIDDSL